MLGAQHYPTLIHELHTELKQQRTGAQAAAGDARWRARAHELAMHRIRVPHDFLDWAKRDRHWSFTLAEVLRESHARPADLAARLAVAMLEQLEDERETLHEGAAVVAAGSAYAD